MADETEGAEENKGRFSVLMLTAEQIGWLHHKLGVKS